MADCTKERWTELVLRVRANDAASEAEVAQLFSPYLMAMAAGRLSDREAAREIVQETLLAVITALRHGRLREPEKLPAFVAGTGRNLINNFLRRRSRNPAPLTLGASESAIPDPDPEGSSLDQDRQRDLVFAVLREINPVDREILFRTLAQGLNPREIALEMGLRPETVRLRKTRALKRIRRKLKGMK